MAYQDVDLIEKIYSPIFCGKRQQLSLFYCYYYYYFWFIQVHQYISLQGYRDRTKTEKNEFLRPIRDLNVLGLRPPGGKGHLRQ